MYKTLDKKRRRGYARTQRNATQQSCCNLFSYKEKAAHERTYFWYALVSSFFLFVIERRLYEYW